MAHTLAVGGIFNLQNFSSVNCRVLTELSESKGKTKGRDLWYTTSQWWVSVFLKYSIYHSFDSFVVGIVYIKTRLHHQKFIQQQHSLLKHDQTSTIVLLDLTVVYQILFIVPPAPRRKNGKQNGLKEHD